MLVFLIWFLCVVVPVIVMACLVHRYPEHAGEIVRTFVLLVIVFAVPYVIAVYWLIEKIS